MDVDDKYDKENKSEQQKIVCKGFMRLLGVLLCLTILGLLVWFEYYMLFGRGKGGM
eukprot:COSAG05_NODE_20914_length_276_cov_0.564972_1_plen_56_part_00